MAKIDLKDRKILYQLDLDSRQSLTQIGKKVGLKKDFVSYRIKRLQDIGVIKNFWTAIDTFKLGYVVYRVYILFQYTTSDVKKEIIDYFVNYKNSWAVLLVDGPIDLSVVIWVKDIQEFYNFWNGTLDKYGDHFDQKTFSVYFQAVVYNNSYLLLDEYSKSDREKYVTTGGGTPIEIDNLDYQLLNELAMNARAPLIELAEKLDCSSQMVNYRMRNLIKQGVIKAFRVTIDISELGLQPFRVDIYLKEHSKRNQIINHLKYNPHLVCLNTSAGYSDIELEFIVENLDELIKIIEEVSSKFPNSIRNYTTWKTLKVYKERWLPEL